MMGPTPYDYEWWMTKSVVKRKPTKDTKLSTYMWLTQPDAQCLEAHLRDTGDLSSISDKDIRSKEHLAVFLRCGGDPRQVLQSILNLADGKSLRKRGRPAQMMKCISVYWHIKFLMDELGGYTFPEAVREATKYPAKPKATEKSYLTAEKFIKENDWPLPFPITPPQN